MTLTRPFGLITLSLCAAAVLAACGGEEPGNPVPGAAGQPGTSQSSGSDPSSGSDQPIPSIAEPLDPSPWLSSPCTALSPEDRTGLGLGEGEERDLETNSAARGCTWTLSDSPGANVHLSVMTENSNGLDDIYRNHENSELREQVDIAGYPALHANFTDRRTSGECTLWVGVNDSEVLLLDAIVEGQDPCGFVDRVGEAVVNNLGS